MLSRHASSAEDALTRPPDVTAAAVYKIPAIAHALLRGQPGTALVDQLLNVPCSLHQLRQACKLGVVVKKHARRACQDDFTWFASSDVFIRQVCHASISMSCWSDIADAGSDVQKLLYASLTLPKVIGSPVPVPA